MESLQTRQFLVLVSLTIISNSLFLLFLIWHSVCFLKELTVEAALV